MAGLALRPGRVADPAAPPVRLSRRARRRRRGRRLARALLVTLLALLVGLGTFVGGLLAAPADFGVNLVPQQKSVLLLANDGTQFATVPPPTRRQPVPAAAIPQVMRQAIISAEDKRFLEHNGVDVVSTLRAALRDLSGGSTQGGSTLTQQYVKNAYVGNDHTLLRKVREASLAVRLERQEPKDQILTDYLNALYLGNGVYGVQAAARYYFGVDVAHLGQDLTPGRGGREDPGLALARASLLAGMAPAPSAWNPVANYTAAKDRQRYTLNNMVVAHFITSQEASDALSRGVTPVQETPPEPPTDAPEFTDLVKAQLRSQFATDEDTLFRGGLRVTTTLDSDLQQAAVQAVHEVLPGADDPEATVAAVDVRNGDVKALTTLRRVPALRDPATGRVTPAVQGYQRDGFDIATDGRRSTGSTIKPFTLAAALEQGHSLSETRYAPNCLPYQDTREVHQFCNAGDSESGTFTLRSALAYSVNTVYVPLADQVGHGRIRQLMLDSGVKAAASGRDRVELRPDVESFGLGTTALVSPLSLASAYATLANHGLATTPKFYTAIRTAPESGGALLAKSPGSPVFTRAMPADVADQVTGAMTDVVTYGTGTAAQQPFTVFGKTGTTDSAKDAWFVGCARSPQNLCVAVWMGYEYANCPTRLVVLGPCGGMKGVHGVPEVYGGTLPAQVFARVFADLRTIQADHARAAAGLPAPSASASAAAPPTGTGAGTGAVTGAGTAGRRTAAPLAPVPPAIPVAPVGTSPPATRRASPPARSPSPAGPGGGGAGGSPPPLLPTPAATRSP